MLQWPDALLTLARCSFNTGLLPDANHKFSQYLVGDTLKPRTQSRAHASHPLPTPVFLLRTLVAHIIL